jgi:hypothetical protein
MTDDGTIGNEAIGVEENPLKIQLAITPEDRKILTENVVQSVMLSRIHASERIPVFGCVIVAVPIRYASTVFSTQPF